MPIEIERKFLVINDGWRGAAVGSQRMRDGLLARFGEGKVRVRITDDRAWLTVKGPRKGLCRAEFEYEIPCSEAEDMLSGLCTGPLIEKTRYFVPHDGLTWEVDVHEGILSGLVLAEIELQREDQALTRPDWVGSEVTGNPSYRKSNLLGRRHA